MVSEAASEWRQPERFPKRQKEGVNYRYADKVSIGGAYSNVIADDLLCRVCL